MKILISSDQIYLHGGIEKVMSTKVNHWVNKEEHEVWVMTTEQEGNPPCYPISPKVHLIDLKVNYNRSKSYFSLENLRKIPRHYFSQKRNIKQIKPDVIISPNFNFDHYWLPFIKGKAKLIKERHGSRYFELEERKKASILQKLKFRFHDWIDSLYHHIVVLNEDEKKYVKSENVIVIPNPIEPSHFKANLASKKIIAAGRISPVKGFDQLIKAFESIHFEFPDWELHIYGQDYLGTQDKLQHYIDSHKLSDAIKFKGSVDNLTEVMQDYSIYAMTSITECFPMVLLEAKSVGMPIISYDCPNGPRNIIHNNVDGIVVENQNIQKFSMNLKSLMKEEEIRCQFGKEANKDVSQYYTIEIMKMWSNLLAL
jgi:glycosyltransferase involved in cell wall biosynthesis